jgi:hypothetical protein
MTIASPWADALNAAAVEVSAVRSGGGTASGSSRLWCLHALEELELAGASGEGSIAVGGLAARDRLRLALRTLGGLPPEVYAERHVADAAASVRRALQLLH